ncbi:MAG: hypothetical protein ACOVMG_06180 [Flavobacterium sp.]
MDKNKLLYWQGFFLTQFLILDEATAAMDRNTENFTMNLFEKIKPNWN